MRPAPGWRVRIYWLHVACTPELTCYGIYQKRGSEAMDEMGILPFYTGIAKHDGLPAYFKYKELINSLCNAHHLRELTWVIENEHQAWAQQMYDLLLDAKAAVDEAKENWKTNLELEQLTGFLSRYNSIIALGYEENPVFRSLATGTKGQKRGRPKKTKPRNLLERLDKYRTGDAELHVRLPDPVRQQPGGTGSPDDQGSAEDLRGFPIPSRGQNLLPDPGIHLYGQEKLCSGIGCNPGCLSGQSLCPKLRRCLIRCYRAEQLQFVSWAQDGVRTVYCFTV